MDEHKPNFKDKDVSQIVYHLFRDIDKKPDRIIKPVLNGLRRLNVVDNIQKDRRKRNEINRKAH